MVTLALCFTGYDDARFGAHGFFNPASFSKLSWRACFFLCKRFFNLCFLFECTWFSLLSKPFPSALSRPSFRNLRKSGCGGGCERHAFSIRTFNNFCCLVSCTDLFGTDIQPNNLQGNRGGCSKRLIMDNYD